MLNEYYQSSVNEYFNIIKKGFPIEELNIQEQLSNYYSIFTGGPNYFKKICDIPAQLEFWAMEDAWNRKEEEYHQKHLLPKSSSDFIKWYERTREFHKAAVKRFFDFLAKSANRQQLAYYVIMESGVDGRFDDIIAMAQVGLDDFGKIAAAKNYWDEMGHGERERMHTVMFNTSVNHMKLILKKSGIIIENIKIPIESLKNGNIILMYATRKKYSLRLLGAIGILEDTASERFEKTVMGLQRLSIPKEAIDYHEEHIDVDGKHGEEWFEHVLLPLVKTEDYEIIKEIAMGILIRYRIASDYYKGIEKKIRELK